MKGYINQFFTEFEYEKADRDILLDAYEKTVANESAKALLTEITAKYESDSKINYKDDILDKSEKISGLTKHHRYTVDLLIFICLTRHLKKLYDKRGIDETVYIDTVLDLKWKLWECKAVKGICGVFVAPWFQGFFNLERFALGRLQFEVVTVSVDYESHGIKLEKGKSRVINVHIPRTGTPMDKESCDAAYQRAKSFFKSEVGEDCPFVCHSWLLYPENKKILPHYTNTYRFISEYEIIEWGENDGEDLWRLFDTEERDPEKLPTNGSLRSAYAEHLRSGGKVGWGFGIKS